MPLSEGFFNEYNQFGDLVINEPSKNVSMMDSVYFMNPRGTNPSIRDVNVGILKSSTFTQREGLPFQSSENKNIISDVIKPARDTIGLIFEANETRSLTKSERLKTNTELDAEIDTDQYGVRRNANPNQQKEAIMRARKEHLETYEHSLKRAETFHNNRNFDEANRITVMANRMLMLQDPQLFREVEGLHRGVTDMPRLERTPMPIVDIPLTHRPLPVPGRVSRPSSRPSSRGSSPGILSTSTSGASTPDLSPTSLESKFEGDVIESKEFDVLNQVFNREDFASNIQFLQANFNEDKQEFPILPDDIREELNFQDLFPVLDLDGSGMTPQGGFLRLSNNLKAKNYNKSIYRTDFANEMKQMFNIDRSSDLSNEGKEKNPLPAILTFRQMVQFNQLPGYGSEALNRHGNAALEIARNLEEEGNGDVTQILYLKFVGTLLTNVAKMGTVRERLAAIQNRGGASVIIQELVRDTLNDLWSDIMSIPLPEKPEGRSALSDPMDLLGN